MPQQRKESNPNTLLKCLTIAGSDSGGGAGIQADLKVFYALGCFGSSVITCLTAQNTKEVRSIFPVSSQFIVEQIDCVLDDIGTNCVKIGMLLNADIIEAVAKRLQYHQSIHKFKLIIDPVMISKSGAHLLDASAIDSFIKNLLPLADVLTPNLPEASALLKRSVLTQQDMLPAAKDLIALGSKAVVIKGGHLENVEESNDLLFYKLKNQEFEHWLNAKRILTNNTHGTGCSFSSALCAFIAKGNDLTNAAVNAKNFLLSGLEEGKSYCLGSGHGPAKF